MRVAAEFADEWNATRVTFDEYPRKLEVLADHCQAVGRDPASIRLSLMALIVIGRTRVEVDARLARGRECFPRVPESPPSGAPRASSSARWTRSCATSSAGRRWASSASCSSASTSTTSPLSSLIAREVIPAVA